MTTKLDSEPSALRLVRESAERRRKAKQQAKRGFPTSVKELRAKHPNGTLVRAHFTVPNGQTVTYEGVLNEEFFQIARAVFDFVEVN